MAYLDHDNTALTIDAVLTKKGREILADSNETFLITKFAAADDEVDYGLWNPEHPDGTDAYGMIIENMPCLEAYVNENQSMRNLLNTQPKYATSIASIEPSSIPDITNIVNGVETGKNLANLDVEYTPKSVGIGQSAASEENGYIVIASTSEYITITPTIGGGIVGDYNDDGVVDEADAEISNNIGNSGGAVIGSGIKEFRITGNNISYLSEYVLTSITVIGVDSGASHTFKVYTRNWVNAGTY